MKFYSVDFIRKCVFLLKKEYFLLRKGVIIPKIRNYHPIHD